MPLAAFANRLTLTASRICSGVTSEVPLPKLLRSSLQASRPSRLDTVAACIGMLMMDFTVESPTELLPRLRLLSDRCTRAIEGS